MTPRPQCRLCNKALGPHPRPGACSACSEPPCGPGSQRESVGPALREPTAPGGNRWGACLLLFMCVWRGWGPHRQAWRGAGHPRANGLASPGSPSHPARWGGRGSLRGWGVRVVSSRHPWVPLAAQPPSLSGVLSGLGAARPRNRRPQVPASCTRARAQAPSPTAGWRPVGASPPQLSCIPSVGLRCVHVGRAQQGAESIPRSF